MVPDRPSPEIYPPYPGTWQEFCSWFADESSCAAYLEHLRWPSGVCCPKCESATGWRTADGRWACSECGRKVSVTAGTIFDRSRIPLQEWFAAAWYMTNQKHGVSALGLQRLLGLGDLPNGIRQIFMWAGSSTAFADGAQTSKFIVAIAIEVLSPKGFGRVRLNGVDGDFSGDSLIPFVCAAVEAGSEVHTDGWNGFNGLSGKGYSHHRTNVSQSGDPAHVSMPGVHTVASLLKRWIYPYRRDQLQPSMKHLCWRICFSLQSPPLSPARTALPQAYATRCSHPAYSVQTLAFQPAEANQTAVVCCT